uniref:Uncharacterized protein n=1 Tax=Panagrolaimus sp. JU765 TaxID=591449 RepID=A0AC34PWP0_9BILA
MFKLILLKILILNLVFVFCWGLCANTGHHCTDTGCRLNGGQCNSVCMCIQRQAPAEFGMFIGKKTTNLINNCVSRKLSKYFSLPRVLFQNFF